MTDEERGQLRLIGEGVEVLKNGKEKDKAREKRGRRCGLTDIPRGRLWSLSHLKHEGDDPPAGGGLVSARSK